ncbi:prephenate dehydratase [Rhodohalobacter sp. SW132]|uniref:prephenate dehydratase n=1 Tax=Rhodohalobacter sp. SW132 TaxID=2293433 RepID=UPI000E21EFE7|nr:prephenate dehydratase [Rhodohalobacter sp. SW132]REL24963.1 prephenate dehydratase [Rhodohalobacter sp. SW132]
MKNDSLEEIRQTIDRLDQTIIDALGERQRIVRNVLANKMENSKEIRDPGREEKMMESIRKKASAAGMDPYFLEQLFREVIHHSVRYQTNALVDHQNEKAENSSIKVAYQGTDGAFSHQVAMRHFKQRYDEVVCVGFTRFDQAAEAVEKGDADVAMLPIENTTAGSINDTYDLLAEKDLFIIGEEILRVIHCLMAPQKVELDNIRRVLSHPQAIAQCSHFLAKLPRCHVESYFDTAMAARKVRNDGDLSQAAIGSAYAAELYDLEILKHDLANQKENYTRFVVVSTDEVSCDPQLNCKTSLIFATADEKGALLSCLNLLGDHGINMTKLESRPRPHHPWQSLFYLDLEGNTEELRVADALEKLKKRAQYVKILGSYPVREGKW